MMYERLSDVGEFGLIRRIDELLDREGVKSHAMTLGIGDDCASIKPEEGYETLVTCDCMIEGRHYLPEYINFFDLGRRAMTVNISDIGAMGGIPFCGLISLGLKKDMAVRDIEDMYRGFLQELNPFDASVIGGNITVSAYSTFIDITLIGKVEREKMTLRSGAREGDAILVTGYPGQAAAGLEMLQNKGPGVDISKDPLVMAYNLPAHRAREGRAVALSGCATSMIDISDGLAGDLGHVCRKSGVGAEIIRNKIPISEHMLNFNPQKGRDIHELIFGDSDDYELIITCSPDKIEDLRSVISEVSDVPVTEIGRIISWSHGIELVLPDGVRHSLRPEGWDHFRNNRKG